MFQKKTEAPDPGLRAKPSLNAAEMGWKAHAAGPTGAEEPGPFSRSRREHRLRRKNRSKLEPVATGGERVWPVKRNGRADETLHFAQVKTTSLRSGEDNFTLLR